MKLEQLEIFVATAAEGSVSRGAEVRGVSQPTASRQLAALAQHVGAELFQRTSHGLRLTAAGREFVPVAQDLLVRHQRGLQAIQQVTGEQAMFIVGAPLNTMHYLLTPFMADREHGGRERSVPGIRDVRTQDPAATYAMLATGEIDLAVGTSPAPAPFASRTLTAVPVQVQCSQPPADARTTAQVTALSGHRLVIPGYGSAVLGVVGEALRHCNVAVEEVREVSSASVAQALAAHDPQLTAVVVEPARFGLHARPVHHHAEALSVQIYAVWDPGHYAARGLARLAGALQRWSRQSMDQTLDWPAERL